MNDQYFAIEAWADGIYQDFEYDYAVKLIEEHGVTKETVQDYRGFLTIGVIMDNLILKNISN